MNEIERAYILRKLQEFSQQQKSVVVQAGPAVYTGQIGEFSDGWLELIQAEDKITLIRLSKISALRFTL